MGARPSRRRLLPPDPPLALDALPPELLVQVLSHVLPCALVTRCRSVCCAWRDVVDGPTVWLLQLARDRSAEGRALYVVAAQQRGGGVSALRPGALLPASAPWPQPHLQLLRRA